MAMTFEQWQQGNGVATRFFSLGRHALVEAFRLGGISAGDKVLLPDFICRDVLASLGAVGAIAVWYPIDATLRPLTNEKEWPDAKVVVAVNYFGFPQPLDCFRSYVARTHALLIEDNAHGFLSRDEEARWLGTRTPLGIFSLRKTLPFADGAMLACSDKSLASQMLPQIKEAGRGFSPNVALKGRLRQIPFVGRRVAGPKRRWGRRC
jgi:dTDP-4-amino-4,6-dideoxygalactose transaminase